MIIKIGDLQSDWRPICLDRIIRKYQFRMKYFFLILPIYKNVTDLMFLLFYFYFFLTEIEV